MVLKELYNTLRVTEPENGPIARNMSISA